MQNPNKQNDAFRGELCYKPQWLAQRLGVSLAAIYAGLRRGTIPSIRLGKRYVIPRAAIDDWLRTANHD